MCNSRPQILDCEAEILLKITETLAVEFQVTKKKLFKIMSEISYDLLHRKNQEALWNNISNWQCFCSSRGLDFVEILLEIPIVLMTDSTIFEERCGDLAEYFANKNEISMLIKNAPSILIEPWPRLEAKIKFLVHEMQVFPRSLAKSKVLLYDLRHIQVLALILYLMFAGEIFIQPISFQDRYEFLHRAGLYQHPSLKNLSTKAEAYPPITEIVETNLKTFIFEVVRNGFRPEEFELFVKMLDHENCESLSEKAAYLEQGHDIEEEVDDAA